MFAISGALDIGDIITTLFACAILAAGMVAKEHNSHTIACTLSIFINFCTALTALFASHLLSSITNCIWIFLFSVLNFSVIKLYAFMASSQ